MVKVANDGLITSVILYGMARSRQTRVNNITKAVTALII
jgi:hypothetical protein